PGVKSRDVVDGGFASNGEIALPRRRTFHSCYLIRVKLCSLTCLTQVPFQRFTISRAATRIHAGGCATATRQQIIVAPALPPLHSSVDVRHAGDTLVPQTVRRLGTAVSASASGPARAFLDQIAALV
ncbi:MAG: hypothetical protein ACRDTV_26035, partial [Mycobacterium sp.]